MEVLIVAKTKWGDYFCIGAIEISSKKFLRLMDVNGGYQPFNTPFKIGQVWDIKHQEMPGIPPHVEDIKVIEKVFLHNIVNLKEYITDNFNIWNGDTTTLFDSKLKWENGSGFLNDIESLPPNSVGFWYCDKDLHFDGKYYIYKNFLINNKKIPYKGNETALQIIPQGTLIRLSLAKWWKKDGFTEKRCYLQLSGWY